MRRAWDESPAANLSPGQTLKASQLPPKSYLEWRYAQVDDGKFLTESLAEVTSQAEEAQQTQDVTQADVVQQSSKAVIQMRRTRVRSQMPATTEQLRHKYRLLAVHWEMICARYSNKGWAAGYKPSVFRDHVDWLLGDDVSDLRAVAAEGRESIKPTWQRVLRCELEIRKEATRRMNMCGKTLGDSLLLARHSDELRTRYLVTPLALGGRRQEPEAAEKVPQPKKQPQQQAQTVQPQKKGKGQERKGKATNGREAANESCSHRLSVRTYAPVRQRQSALETQRAHYLLRVPDSAGLHQGPGVPSPAHLRPLLWQPRI